MVVGEDRLTEEERSERQQEAERRAADVQEMVLMALGNLCSDAVDYNSALTKHQLLEGNGHGALLACVRALAPCAALVFYRVLELSGGSRSALAG